MSRTAESSGSAIASTPDTLHTVPWTDVLPWLDDYVSDRAAVLEALGRDEWWLEDSPAGTARETDLDGLVSRLAEVIACGHADTVFSDLFPNLDAAVPVAALGLDARAGALVRRACPGTDLTQLLEQSVQSLFGVEGTSEDTVRTVVAALVGCAVRVDPAAHTPPEQDVPPVPAVVARLLDDLTALARWNRVRGRADGPLIGTPVEDDAPEYVHEAMARIRAVTAGDLPAPDTADPLDEIENLIEQLDDRDRVVLRDRLAARHPVTQGALAARLHVGASRVSALESVLRQRFARACGFGTAVGDLLAGLRVEIQPIASLDRLLTLYPALAESVPSLGVPMWLLLDRIDDHVEVTDGWAAAPNVRTARRRTLSLLHDHESDNGVVALAALHTATAMPRDELARWLGYCEVPVVADHAVTRTRRLADLAVGTLEALGVPSTAAEVAAALDSDRLPSSFERVLNQDERVCADDGRHRLRAWDDDADDFVADAHGALRRRTEEAPRSPERAASLYRIGLGWHHRVIVTDDLLRGGAASVPAGAATAVDCQPGGSVALTSRLGDQMIRWNGPQPLTASIRRFLAEAGARPGDAVHLVFGPGPTFDLHRESALCEDAPPLRRALARIGHPAPDEVSERALVKVLADAIGLGGETRPRRLLPSYARGGEDDLVALLESAWIGDDGGTRVGSATASDATSEPGSSDDLSAIVR